MEVSSQTLDAMSSIAFKSVNGYGRYSLFLRPPSETFEFVDLEWVVRGIRYIWFVICGGSGSAERNESRTLFFSKQSGS